MTAESDAPSSANNDGPKTAFVISPIGVLGTEEFVAAKTVLDYIIRKALPEPAWQVIRADSESAPDSITAHIIGRIVQSDLIVADLSGHNPNVFYELAVAHGYSRPVIQIMTDGGTIPFDVKDQRVIYYDTTSPASVDRAIGEIRAATNHLETTQEQARNPLTDYGNFHALSTSGTSGQVLAQFIETLTAQMNRLERQVAKLPWNASAYEDNRVWRPAAQKVV